MKDVIAKVGEVATLPCDYNIPEDNPLKHYTVYWQKYIGSGLLDKVAIAYHEGKEDKKDPYYQHRTTMDQRNFTLWISSVKVSDEGQYTCYIFKNGSKIHHTDLHLSVVGK